mgnify:CR=1 FL=1
MSSDKYLDANGLEQLWQKIGNRFPRMAHWTLTAGGGAATFVLESGSRVVLYAIGPGGGGRGSHIISVGSSISRTAVGSTSDLSFSASGRNLTITNNNANYAANLFWLIFAGGVTTN